MAVVKAVGPSGLWRVPRKMKLFSCTGGEIIDLREAILPAGPDPTVIHCFLFMGVGHIRVPDGIYVEVERKAFFKSGAPNRQPPSGKAPWLRIVGCSLFGRLKVS